MGLGGLLWRLSTGPLEIAQVAEITERLLSQTLGAGNKARVAKAELDWSSDTYGIIIRLVGIEIDDGHGGFSVSVPSADIELRTLPLLWGSIKPAALDLDDPHVRIDIGRIDPGMMAQMAAAVPGATPPAEPAAPATDGKPVGATDPASPGKAIDPRPASLRLLERFARVIGDAMESARAEGLTSVNASGGQLEFIRSGDKGVDVRVVIPEITLDSSVDAAGNVDMSFSAKGEFGNWDMRLRRTSLGDGLGRKLVFEARNVTLRDLIGTLPPDIAMTIPIYPTIEAEVDPQQKLTAMRLDLRLGAGLLHFGKFPEDEIVIDEGLIAVAWDPARNDFSIEHAGASRGNTIVSLKGRATPPRRDATAADAGIWSFVLDLDQGVLAPQDAGGEPLLIDLLRIVGTADLNTRRLNLPTMEAQLGGSILAGTGLIDFAREKPQVIVSFNLSPTDIQVVRHAWPAFIASGGRNWFLKQVTAGKVVDGQIKLDLPLLTEPRLLPPTSLIFSGRFLGAAMHTFGDLPDAVGLEGRFSSRERRLEAVVEKGVVATRYPKKPEIAELKLIIPDSFPRNPRGRIEFHVVGENGAIGEIVNSEPLAILDDANVRQEGLQGSADVRGSVDLTLDDQPKLADMEYRVDAALDRFGSPHPILGRKFQDGAIKVVADMKGTTVSGKAKIDGVIADVNLFEPRVKSGKLTERRDFKLTLDDASRQRMGLDLGKLLSGPIAVSIAQAPGGNEKSRHIDADLTTARVTLAPFGWTKGAGVPAKAVMDINEDDKSMRLDNLSVESEGLQIKGRVELDRDRKPLTADFAKFALHKGDDAKLKLSRQPDQSVQVTFEAGNFDARGLLQLLKHQGDSGATDKSKPQDMVVRARVARLVGFNEVALTDAVVDATMRGGALLKLSLSGHVPGGRAMEIQVRPEGANRLLTVTSDDAGAVLGFLDIYDKMRGGNLSLTSTLAGPGVANGNLRIVGFKLQPQTKSERVVTTAEDGTRSVAIRQASVTEDTSFDRFAANFSLRQGVITVTDGIAKGPTTGATASGQIDLNSEKIKLTGTFIPLYGLNNLVSRIPLLGEIAGANRNEGLLGVTFKIVGSVDDPVLQVNPISAIAPGIFRKIFEYHVQ